jgi:tRNA pseudouridine55 synthase
LDACLLPIEVGMTAWPVVAVTPAQAQRLGQGQSLNGDFQPAGAVALFDEHGRALGLGEVDHGGCLRPQRLFTWACVQPPRSAAIAS